MPGKNKELPPQYNPHGLENKWYPIWEKNNYFSWKRSVKERGENPEKLDAARLRAEKKVFSMVIPPPNVTGSLHLGHALNHTIQDILSRYHRMKGDLTLWVPGTDHAGIATQNVVEKLLAKEGKKRWEMGREAFEQRVWQWKAESGGMITHQQRQLGESVDWNYERFTLDDGLSQIVRKVFVQLYNEGLIYRGERIINWCPKDVTALSNIEVEYREHKGKLYYVKYPVEGRPGEYVIIATTRPETMPGDEAVAVHPDDLAAGGRYQHLKNARVILPLLNKPLPVIGDSFVDQAFGSGVVKITPAHDPNDFEAGARHSLPITRVMDDHGRMNEKAGPYQGLSREEARRRIVEDLEAQGLLEKVEEIQHSVGECYRCQTIVEPISSLQWFVKTAPLAKKSIEVVESGKIEFIPKRWENTYFEWMNNIQDWCISRQLWWGHRIPAYYCQQCGQVHVSEEELKSCPACGHHSLRQEEDVLDTWFSSALWPFSTLLPAGQNLEQQSWPARSQELDLFYPTSVLVTGFDIIFFWVARMIMMGMHLQQNIPFEKVYIHGLVRDASRQKMSKSKGNVVNPLEKMEEYGTDAFRFFLMSILPEGKDIIFDESRLKGYQAFCNKIWNTARYIWMNQPQGYQLPEKLPGQLHAVDHWILHEYNQTLQKTSEALESFRFADYTQLVYDFFWKSFCDNYVELSKISLKDESSNQTTLYVLNFVFQNSLKLLHPVMPFITEELYSFWHESQPEKLILVSSWPEQLPADSGQAAAIEEILHVVYKIRQLRAEFQIPPGEKLNAAVYSPSEKSAKNLADLKNYIEKLARLENLYVLEDQSRAPGIQAGLDFGRLYLDAGDRVDRAKEQARLNKEIENLENVLKNLEQKLGNADFMARAPQELVQAEREKAAQYKRKIGELQELLHSLD